MPILNAPATTTRLPWAAAARRYYATGRFGNAILTLVYFALWTVTGRYWGLQHDAQAYAVQALAKLRPEIYAGDLFLRFESQDDYTLFPHLAAWVIGWLGLDHAAALLTFVFVAGWIVVSWHLARALAGRELAWLAIGLLLVIPGWYGAGLVFRTAEPFLSARPAAEILCLGAVLSFVRGRQLLAAGLSGLAAVVHPIMAFPVALVLLGLAAPSSESRGFWPVAALACFIGAVAGSFVVGGASPVMSEDWLQLTRTRSDYLFTSNWQTADWQANALPLLTVLLASHVLCGWSQRLARAAFWVAASGLLLAALSSAVVPLTLLLQGQPWRWMWLCNVLSIVLLPCIVESTWRRDRAGRAVALLICSAWLLAQWSSSDQLPPAGVAGLLLVCALALWSVRDRLRPRLIRTILVGATMSLAVTLLGLGMTMAAALSNPFDFGTDPLWVQKIADILELIGASVCIVTAAWWLTVRSWTSLGGTLVGVAAAVLSLGALPSATRSWIAESYSTDERAAFSDWRGRIPPDAEVLWPDGLQETWFLLDRRSYLTVSQLGGIVFSADLAHEARRRAGTLAPLISPGHWFIDPASSKARFAPLSREVLARICAVGGPDFVVDKVELGTQVAMIEWPGRGRFRYLYDCRTVRQVAATVPVEALVTELSGDET